MPDNSPSEILQKAITKAIDNGWNYLGRPENGWGVGAGQWHTSEHHLSINHHKLGDEYTHRNEIIFNHDFAKALWGETTEYEIPSVAKGKHNWAKVAWQYHLQQMVIAEDPVKYLGENI